MLFLSNQFKVLSLICFGLCIFLLTRPLPVLAHSFDLSTSFEFTGSAYEQQTQHEDQDPFKGWANITVENTGTENWGDFHFEIFQVGTETVENVDFIVSDPYQPTSSQSGLTWSVDNDVVGATLDLYFYSDPVLPGETANFSVYTDNTTDQLSFFGTAFYPSPVPIPSAFWLLFSGLTAFLGIRNRKRLIK